MQLLGRLEGISTMLHTAVQGFRHRRTVGERAAAAPAREDVDRAWDLLGRTIRWWGVLLMRLCADLEAEKAALRQEFAPEMAAIAPPAATRAEPGSPGPGSPGPVRAEPGAPDPGRAATPRSTAQIMERACANLGAAMAMLSGAAPPPLRARPASHGRVRARPRAPRAPHPDSAIRRKSVADIFDQMCADLGAAATLLGETDAAREVAAIAAAARALFAGAEAGCMSTPTPVPGVRAAGGGPLPLSAAAAPRAPDSG